MVRAQPVARGPFRIQDGEVGNTTLAAFICLLLTGCGLTPSAEAPEVCGFPESAALFFAGRSTTSALGVQEVVGDPMSDDPADISVTRDRFDQGELNGRLVCAVFVHQPAFVEVTVHPADVGGPSDAQEPSASAQTAGETIPATIISKDDAIETARGALPAGETWEVTSVNAGQLDQVGVVEDETSARALPGDRYVWQVMLVRGDRAAIVIMDYVDGSCTVSPISS